MNDAASLGTNYFSQYGTIGTLLRCNNGRHRGLSKELSMKRFIVSTAAAAALFAVAPAAYAATFPVGGSNFTATPGPNGTFAGAFFNTGIAAGAFSDTFTFTLPASGFGSGTVTTSATTPGSPNDLDFTSVFVNGVAAGITRTQGGLFEVAFTNNIPVFGGVLNTIVVNGVSRGGGAYGGQATFSTVSAVPEAATWAMMLVGFGMIGAASRYRRRTTGAAFA